MKIIKYLILTSLATNGVIATDKNLFEEDNHLYQLCHSRQLPELGLDEETSISNNQREIKGDISNHITIPMTESWPGPITRHNIGDTDMQKLVSALVQRLNNSEQRLLVLEKQNALLLIDKRQLRVESQDRDNKIIALTNIVTSYGTITEENKNNIVNNTKDINDLKNIVKKQGQAIENMERNQNPQPLSRCQLMKVGSFRVVGGAAFGITGYYVFVNTPTVEESKIGGATGAAFAGLFIATGVTNFLGGLNDLIIRGIWGSDNQTGIAVNRFLERFVPNIYSAFGQRH